MRIAFEQVSYSYRKADPAEAKGGRGRRRGKAKGQATASEQALGRAAWGADPNERWALRDVSFDVEPGEFMGLAGHTGSGKSTLIQHMNALLHPTEGRVLADGRDLADKGWAQQCRGKVGLVFQYPEHQLFAPTVAQDVAFGPRNLGLSGDELDARVRQALERVHLDVDEVGARSPFELSGGQQRRVAFAGVLAMDPQVLVLDEPVAGLDPVAREDFFGPHSRAARRGHVGGHGVPQHGRPGAPVRPHPGAQRRQRVSPWHPRARCSPRARRCAASAWTCRRPSAWPSSCARRASCFPGRSTATSRAWPRIWRPNWRGIASTAHGRKEGGSCLDITCIGRYWPGDSPIHRMDARAKLLLSLAVMAIAFVAQTFCSLAVVAVFVAGLFVLSGIPLGSALRSIVPLIFIVVITALLNVLFVQDGRRGGALVGDHHHHRRHPHGLLHRSSSGHPAAGYEPAHPDHAYAGHHRRLRVPAWPLPPLRPSRPRAVHDDGPGAALHAAVRGRAAPPSTAPR